MKRLLPFLIIAAVALITGGAAVWLYWTKLSAPSPIVASPPTPLASPIPPAADNFSIPPLLARAPEDGAADPIHALGPETAPAQLEIYGDFQCPPCATTTLTIDKLVKNYGPQLRVIFHEFPLAMHAHALPAAMAAEAAGLQGHFWEMHDLLYKFQEVWSKASAPTVFFQAYAQSLGLDEARFARDARSDALRAQIMRDASAGAARGVRNTPTLFINGKEVRGFDEAALRAAIDASISPKKAS